MSRNFRKLLKGVILIFLVSFSFFFFFKLGVQASQPNKIVAVSVNGFDPQISYEKLSTLLADEYKIPFSKFLKIPNESYIIVFFDNYRDLNDGINRLESKEYNGKDLTILQLSSSQDILNLYGKAKTQIKKTPINKEIIEFMPYINLDYSEIKDIKTANAVKVFEQKFSTTLSSYAIKSDKFTYIMPTAKNKYLNFANFQVGYTNNQKIAAGFERGSKKKPFIEPVNFSYICYHPQIIECVKRFETLMSSTSTVPYSQSTGEGIWKSIFVYAGQSETMIHFEVAQQLSKPIKDSLLQSFHDFSAITLKLPNQNRCEIVLQNDYIVDNIAGCYLPIYPLISIPPSIDAFENLINHLKSTSIFNDDHFIINIFSVNAYISTSLASFVDSVYFISPKSEMEWPKLAVKSNKLKNFNFQKVTNYSDDIKAIFKDYDAENGIAILEPQDVTRQSIMETVANSLIQCDIKNIFIYFQSKQGMKNTLSLFSDDYNIKECILIDYFPHSNYLSYLVWLVSH